jgi:hypothetical protein
MRAAYLVADEDHSGFEIARLPRVQKPVRRPQGEDIPGIMDCDGPGGMTVWAAPSREGNQ